MSIVNQLLRSFFLKCWILTPKKPRGLKKNVEDNFSFGCGGGWFSWIKGKVIFLELIK